MKLIIKVLLVTISLVGGAQINDEEILFEKRDRQTCSGDQECSANSYCFDWGKINVFSLYFKFFFKKSLFLTFLYYLKPLFFPSFIK